MKEKIFEELMKSYIILKNTSKQLPLHTNRQNFTRQVGAKLCSTHWDAFSFSWPFFFFFPDIFNETQQIILCLFQSVGFALSLKLLGKWQLLLRLDNWIHNLYSFFYIPVGLQTWNFQASVWKSLCLDSLQICTLFLKKISRVFLYFYFTMVSDSLW